MTPDDASSPHAASRRRSRWLFLPAAALVLPALVGGCSSSSKPAYCTAETNLKTSVQSLGDVSVTQNGLSSLQTAVSDVKTNAQKFADEAKTTFSPQTTALKNALSSLGDALKAAQASPSLATVQAVGTAVKAVSTAATNLETAVSGKC